MTTDPGHSAGGRLAGAPGEALPEPSGPGAVVLDIGGDIGAAVISTSPALVDREIEIRPDGEEWAGRHVAVRERKLGDTVVHAAVFSSLPVGRYDLRVRHGDDGATALSIEVVGGRVSNATWPE